ncbi:MAG TPA: hypothetical protein VGP41_14955 [Candidatus Lustribacter sp.]|jgi:hypothetical protein|nr:hypothetical protein [Candidatus Lustribacter sp.]
MKEFALHWGSGVIEEEVQICHYDLRGRFQRSPLIITADDLPRLRKALATAPRLKKLLSKALAG